ncbi:MAG: carotenoid oxygenase family protein, partial [Candidatus Nanopelagicales bacterium]
MNHLFDAALEHDLVLTPDDIDGLLPEGLAGVMVRNGPADFRLAEHEFDGDGMLRRLHLAPDGTVHFRSRYVQTAKRSVEARSRQPMVRGFGTQIPGGPLRNLRAARESGNAANTSVMRHQDCLLTLWEAGHPYRVDADDLSTLGPYDFEGQLAAELPFSAHPKFDPTTGELFNFGLHYGRTTQIVTYRLDRQGTLATLARTPVAHAPFLHDFALTATWCVYLVGPADISLLPFLTGMKSVNDSIRWHPDRGTQVVLVARDGSRNITFDVDPWFQFHIGGAFDLGDEVVVDLVRFDSWYSVAEPLKEFRDPKGGEEGNLWRFRIDTARRSVTGEPICDLGVEFPQYDQRRTTQEYTYSYLAQHPGWLGTGGIVRVNVQTSDVDTFDLPEGCRPSEPLFCPRPGGNFDEGWVISWVWNPVRQATDVLVLDAQHIADGPLATLK